jgi:hypothetical protein
MMMTWHRLDRSQKMLAVVFVIYAVVMLWGGK